MYYSFDNYIKLICLYVGRTIDSQSEVSFCWNENGICDLYDWNIADKPKPTIAELEALQPQVEAQENKEKILSQIIELDSKRSRAFFEPSEKEPNLTWLDYYNQEILKLRTQLSSIQST